MKILLACQNTILAIDEAYINFVPETRTVVDFIVEGNLIVIRSMTKDYALAGLRLGYAVACQEIIAFLKKVCPPWNVNCFAQSAGKAALADNEYLARCRKDIWNAKNFLVEQLSSIGLVPLPSDTHFFLVNVRNAYNFRQELLRYGILVRDCASFGLPEYVRIAPRTLPECERLVDAIRRITV